MSIDGFIQAKTTIPEFESFINQVGVVENLGPNLSRALQVGNLEFA